MEIALQIVQSLQMVTEAMKLKDFNLLAPWKKSYD